jgi:hypothetical protein
MENQQANVQIEKGKKEERRFKLSEPLIKYKEAKGQIISSKNPHGMYSDNIPLSAARKCYRRIARSMQLEAEKEGKPISKVNQRVVFCLLELGNRGVEIDRFYYVGDNKIKKPITKFVGHNIKTGKNKTITTHVKPDVKALTEAEYTSMTSKPMNRSKSSSMKKNEVHAESRSKKSKSKSKKSKSKSKSKSLPVALPLGNMEAAPVEPIAEPAVMGEVMNK